MRYALFYTPPASHELTHTAAHWLGRDAYSGALHEQQARGALSADRLAELTVEPRRYGFHATMKAPFHLSGDSNESQLISAMEQFCKSRTAFTMPTLKVGRLGPFFALVPDSNEAELNSFAADIVRHFEMFRAPLSEADYARRSPEKLAPQQREYLQQWGYPYIFDAFRFHMTLSGPVPNEEADQIEDILNALFEPHLRAPLMCANLTLFCEAERAAPFTIHSSIPLASYPITKAATL